MLLILYLHPPSKLKNLQHDIMIVKIFHPQFMSIREHHIEIISHDLESNINTGESNNFLIFTH